MMKVILRGDPSSPQKKLARQSVVVVRKEVLADRIAFLLKKKTLRHIDSVAHVPAVFIWWKKDFVPEQRRREIERMFDTVTSVTIPGEHGWIWRRREIVNSHLKTFLNIHAT